MICRLLEQHPNNALALASSRSVFCGSAGWMQGQSIGVVVLFTTIHYLPDIPEYITALQAVHGGSMMAPCQQYWNLY